MPDPHTLEKVARAICKSRTCEGFKCCQWPASGGRLDCPAKRGGYDDAAKNAILAYESSLKEKGMVIVPEEPTEEMLVAGVEVDVSAPVWSYDNAGRKHYHCTLPGHIYRAMLSSIPTPEGEG